MTRQVLGSLLAGLLIVIATVAIVTAKIGPGVDTREREEEREELLELREEEREERQEAREEQSEG